MKKIVVFGRKDALETKIVHKFLEERNKGELITSVVVGFRVHQAVIWSWKPIDDYPPVPKEEWDKTPESVKKIIRESICAFIILVIFIIKDLQSSSASIKGVNPLLFSNSPLSGSPLKKT